MTANDLFFNLFFIILYFLFTVCFFVALFFIYVKKKRKKYIELEEYNLTFLQVKVPAETEVEIKAAEHFFSSIAGFQKSWWQALTTEQYRISFEIVSKNSGIAFYVVVPDEIAAFIEKQINGVYPDAEIDIINPQEIWDRGEFTSVAELVLGGAPYFPIKVYEELKSDAISSITSGMSKLGDDEVIAVQYLISPASNNWRRAGQAFITHAKNRVESGKGGSLDSAFLEGIEKKIAHAGFDVSIRIISISKDKFSADAHVRSIASVFEQFTNLKYTSFRRRGFISDKKIIDNFIYRQLDVVDIYLPLFDISLYRNVSVLNTVELATVFHFPNKEVKTPNIVWLTARQSSAPTNLPTEGLYLGKSVFRSIEKKVFMTEKDRTRHFYIIGQTGTGKSEYMKSLAIQDIKAGHGIAFIDPHGSDIDDILQKIPPERVEDVILFDASDTDMPLGLNILESENEEQRHMIINSFIGLLYKLYDPNHQGIMGPQLERAIRNVMLTAMEDPGATMVDVLRLLIDQKYVQKFLPLIKDPLVKKYWTDEVANTSQNRKGEMLGYIVSKFDRFVTEKTMRNILGQPKSAFSFNKIMAEKKIFLVDLSKGKIGEENSNFIGLLLVPRILTAALGRAALLGKEEFPDFYLYVDEFQNFATPDFATILSEARKYKLNLIVAHQFVSQLSDEIKEAIFGNVGTITSFRIGVDDAEYLKGQFEPIFTPRDLINLPIGNCYARLLINGHPSTPFSMKVDWSSINETKKDPAMADLIRNRSRTKYGMSVKDVEDYINLRAGLNEPTEPPVEAKPRIPF